MNFEIIVSIILVVSFLAMAWLAFKKISELKNLPHKESIIPVGKLKEKIKHKTISYWKNKGPEFYHFLQKSILKARDLFTKADNKMLDLLLKLRQKTDKGKIELDDYWKDIKTNIKKNNRRKKIVEVNQENKKEVLEIKEEKQEEVKEEKK
jgi:hypothetical protein